jgi:hypothetical protein
MEKSPLMEHDMSADMRACRDACNVCRDACLLALAHSIERGGALAGASQLEALLDCATICDTTSAFLTRGSAQHAEVCHTCARICIACETSCRAVPDGKTLRGCADACRICADSCARMTT